MKKGTIGISLVLIGAVGLSGGCATHRSKTLALMAGGALVGGTLGALTRPSDESGAMHALFGAGIGATASGVAGLFVFDSEAEKRALDKENRRMSFELSELIRQMTPELIEAEPDVQTAHVPNELKRLIKPMEWELYSLGPKSQGIWVKKTENTWVKECQMMVHVPSSMRGSVTYVPEQFGSSIPAPSGGKETSQGSEFGETNEKAKPAVPEKPQEVPSGTEAKTKEGESHG